MLIWTLKCWTVNENLILNEAKKSEERFIELSKEDDFLHVDVRWKYVCVVYG